MKTFLSAMILLLSASALSAQTPDQQIARSIDNARQRGIPVELLESKVAEGRAKGVPAARIAIAVDRRLEALVKAQGAVDRRHQLTTAELGVAGDAIQAGVSESALSTLAGTAPRERRAVAIATLAQLVQLGEASETALRQVTDAMQKGPEALMMLPAQAAANAARRGPPAGVPGADKAPANRGGTPAGVPPRGKPDSRGNSGN